MEVYLDWIKVVVVPHKKYGEYLLNIKLSL